MATVHWSTSACPRVPTLSRPSPPSYATSPAASMMATFDLSLSNVSALPVPGSTTRSRAPAMQVSGSWDSPRALRLFGGG